MNWISNYVRPRINSIFSRRETPENLWSKCDECGTMLFHRELSDNLNVCTNCDHHMPINARDRLTSIFDGGVFTDVAVPEPRLDKLVAIAGSKEIIPARINFVDVAGLVRGASKGEGLGNQFLANIRDCDAVAFVSRCFIDDDITGANLASCWISCGKCGKVCTNTHANSRINFSRASGIEHDIVDAPVCAHRR